METVAFRRRLARDAGINIGFFVVSILLMGADTPRTRSWILPAGLFDLALFGISYAVLLFRVMSARVGRQLPVQGWIQAWTFGVGAAMILGGIGLLRFLFPG
jgi:hypothetical protein